MAVGSWAQRTQRGPSVRACLVELVRVLLLHGLHLLQELLQELARRRAAAPAVPHLAVRAASGQARRQGRRRRAAPRRTTSVRSHIWLASDSVLSGAAGAAAAVAASFMSADERMGASIFMLCDCRLCTVDAARVSASGYNAASAARPTARPSAAQAHLVELARQRVEVLGNARLPRRHIAHLVRAAGRRRQGSHLASQRLTQAC